MLYTKYIYFNVMLISPENHMEGKLNFHFHFKFVIQTSVWAVWQQCMYDAPPRTRREIKRGMFFREKKNTCTSNRKYFESHTKKETKSESLKRSALSGKICFSFTRFRWFQTQSLHDADHMLSSSKMLAQRSVHATPYCSLFIGSPVRHFEPPLSVPFHSNWW